MPFTDKNFQNVCFFDEFVLTLSVEKNREEIKMLKQAKSILTLLLLLTVANRPVIAQIERADYLWLVDVSGRTNIYIDAMQHAIDTFYVEASRHDHLHVYHFAKHLAAQDEMVDGDFYDYSDMGQMLHALDSLIKQSKSKYVRAFILSDFFNDIPSNHHAPLNLAAYHYLKDEFQNDCMVKNVYIYLLQLPPSSMYGVNSLSAIQSLMPFQYCELRPTTPDEVTTRYLLSKVEELNRLRGIRDDVKPAPASPLPTYFISIMFGAVLLGVGIFFLVKYIKQRKK